MWSRVLPDLSKIKIFGWKALAYVPSQNRSKIDLITTKCIFIGYFIKYVTYQLVQKSKSIDEIQIDQDKKNKWKSTHLSDKNNSNPYNEYKTNSAIYYKFLTNFSLGAVHKSRDAVRGGWVSIKT